MEQMEQINQELLEVVKMILRDMNIIVELNNNYTFFKNCVDIYLDNYEEYLINHYSIHQNFVRVCNDNIISIDIEYIESLLQMLYFEYDNENNYRMCI